MSDNIKTTTTTRSVEEQWRLLREQGPHKLVDLSSNDLIADKPAWLDEQRFKLAKEAVQKLRIGMMYSSFTGLLMILQLPDGLEPLLSTGNSKDVPSLYQRYLNTIIHVESWYDDDVFNPDTKGYKSVRQVRAMHKRMQNNMNQKHRTLDVNGRERKWFTQYDVALTQFSFIGVAMLWPARSGLIKASRQELELLNYYWRVLGHLMGIDDEFNHCRYDNYDDILAYNKLVFEREFAQVYAQHKCELGLEMTKGICLALEHFLPMITFNMLAHWWAPHFSFNGYTLRPMSLRERVLYGWTQLSFDRFFQSERFLRLATKLHKMRFQARLKNRDKFYNEIKAKYGDKPELTYLSERVEYFDSSSLCPVSATIKQQQQQVNKSAAQQVSACPLGFTAPAIVAAAAN